MKIIAKGPKGSVIEKTVVGEIRIELDNGEFLCISEDQKAVITESKEGKRDFVKVQELRDISEGVGFIFTKKTINSYAEKSDFPLLTDEELEKVFDIEAFKKVANVSINMLIDDVLRNFYDEKNEKLCEKE